MTINYFKLPVLQQPKCTNVLCDIYAEREREKCVHGKHDRQRTIEQKSAWRSKQTLKKEH